MYYCTGMKIPFSRAVCFSTQVACALIIAGENLKNHVDVKNVLVDIGIYFQVQDDISRRLANTLFFKLI
ncbi:unnamed protein product [Arabidopsis lyrata]|nr:unnamed protein product [Arabidopsis lyrata]